MNPLTFVGLLQAINRLLGIHGLACSLCRSDVARQQIVSGKSCGSAKTTQRGMPDDDPKVFCTLGGRLRCLRRSGVAGFATLGRWLAGFDVLFLRRNNADLVLVLPWQVLPRILEAVR
jgi:hypothetical protein